MAAGGGRVAGVEKAVGTRLGERGAPVGQEGAEQREPEGGGLGVKAGVEAEGGEDALQRVVKRGKRLLGAIAMASPKAEARGGASAKAKIVAAAPRVEVVAAGVAGKGVVGGFVAAKPGVAKTCLRLGDGVAKGVGRRRGKALPAPEAFGFEGEGVNRDVGKAQGGDAAEGVAPGFGGDAGEAGDEVDARVGDRGAGDVEGVEGLAGGVAATAAGKRGVVERLHAEAEAGDAKPGEGADEPKGDGGGMKLHRPLAPFGEGEEPGGAKALEPTLAEDRRGAAATVETVQRGEGDGAGAALAQEFPHIGFGVRGRWPGDEGAISAAARAEGDVEVKVGRGRVAA